MPSIIDDPNHWRDRAAEARAMAGALDDAVSKRQMLEIAEGYDRLAERAEARAKSSSIDLKRHLKPRRPIT